MKRTLFVPFVAALAALLVSCTSTGQVTESVVKEEAPAEVASEQSDSDLDEIRGYSKRSPYFRADRYVFEDASIAKSWLDATADEIMRMRDKVQNLRFDITGYVAVFPNEIDGVWLSKKRAEVIADGLVKRGIPADAIQTIPGGNTKRFSDSVRRENRVATIAVVVE